MSLQKIIKDIIKTSNKDPKDVFQKLVKLQEEIGEVSDSVLRRNGLKSPKGKPIKELDNDVLEEIADVIIITASLLAHFNADSTNLELKLEEKFKKWKTNMESYKEWQKEIKNG